MEKFPYISMVKFKISLVENQCLPFRSSRSQKFLKVGVLLKVTQYSQENTCVGVSFFNKFPVLQACKFIKEKLQQCFPMDIAKCLRTAFSIEHFRSLLLPFTTTFRNYYWKDHLITVNKDHVHSTPEKHLKKVLGMIQSC